MNFQITQFETGQQFEISQLLRTVFDEFEAPEYSEEGNQLFYEWITPDQITPDQIAQRQELDNTLWVATEHGKIVGMIEMRDQNKISLLFVDKAFHRKGIAKALMDFAIATVKLSYPEINLITVNSSPYAVVVYEYYGFRSVGEFQITNGIRYLPMSLNL